ncbi:MAG: winged helix-turn-helix domain-containing protein [Candidatus Eremiobacteraeota bacterium]|nr:winged helix-turn-helix domain-containing protein [Candidatus Eremiobacteraeota bacterium]
MYEFGPYRLDTGQMIVLSDGIVVPLGPRVVATLAVLIEHAGEIVSKDELIERVWPEGFVEDSSLTQNIYILRKTLGQKWDVETIQTLPRRGYRFVAPLTGDHPHVLHAQSSRPSKKYALLALAVFGAFAVVAGLLIANRNATMPTALDPGTQRLNDLGAFYWQQRTPEGEKKSVALFKKVVDRAPLSALGYLGLAHAYLASATYCFAPGECAADARLAKGMTERALKLDPLNAQAHAVAGAIASELDNDDATAKREFERAIQLDPNDALAHHWYGATLVDHRQFDAGRTQLETAVRLDPTSAVMAAWLARAYYYLGRYDEAISFDKQSLQLSPRFDSNATLGLAYEAKGDYRNALMSFDALGRLGAVAKARVYRASVYARSGNRALALREMAGLRPTARPRESRGGGGRVFENYQDVKAADIAAVYFALGDTSTGMRWLRDATDRNAQSRRWLAVDPRFTAKIQRTLLSTR